MGILHSRAIFSPIPPLLATSMKPSSSVLTNKVVVTSLSIFVTIMPRHRLHRGSSKSFLLSGHDMSNNDGSASLPSCSHDDVSNNSPSFFSVLPVDFMLLIIPDCNITLRVA
jgi:hypothetical protein